MRGTRAKKLRRQVYGPRSEWTKEGYFPCHPALRSYTIMTRYQRMVPKLILASDDSGEGQLLASFKQRGKLMNYRYVPFEINGRFEADTERQEYRKAKAAWKRG